MFEIFVSKTIPYTRFTTKDHWNYCYCARAICSHYCTAIWVCIYDCINEDFASVVWVLT